MDSGFPDPNLRDLDFRFAVVSDPHIGLPHTLWQHPQRFHLVEVSIPALEMVFARLEQLELDFLLMPGDLTQHGEPDNHAWLSQRLARLPFPVYVVPGNHDIPVAKGYSHFPLGDVSRKHRISARETLSVSPGEPEVPTDSYSIDWQEFPSYYRNFGYQNTDRLYYTCELLPGVRLIALNSNQFDAQGKQIGALDLPQERWLEQLLASVGNELVLVMIHHNVIEHIPGQTHHPMGKRYMLQGADQLLSLLQTHQVRLLFTGHLHVQDIAVAEGVYEITTGSLVSYPHPYRVVQIKTTAGHIQVQIESMRVESLPDWPDLLTISREWMGDRSLAIMTHFLSHPPLSLPLHEAQSLAPELRYFWATIAAGNPSFQFPHFPPAVREYLEGFGDIRFQQQQLPILGDNTMTLKL